MKILFSRPCRYGSLCIAYALCFGHVYAGDTVAPVNQTSTAIAAAVPAASAPAGVTLPPTVSALAPATPVPQQETPATDVAVSPSVAPEGSMAGMSAVVPAAQPAPTQVQPTQEVVAPVTTPSVQPTEQAPVQEAVPVPVQPASQEKTVVAAEPEKDAPLIDTIDITTGGNWLKKRGIWEDAQRKYEKIKGLVSEVLNSRVQFFLDRANLDKELNLFFVEIGFAQGELEQILETIVGSLEGEKAKQGVLDEKERALQTQLVQKKSDLEQMKLDLKSLAEFDSSLEEALMQLVQQITAATTYEQQAWEKFKEIGQELDDKKAREHFMQIEACATNIENVLQYIKGPYSTYFATVAGKIQELSQSVKSRLVELKSAGIELKERFKAIAQPPVKAPEAPKPPKPTGWLGSIGKAIANFFAALWYMIRGLFGA